MLEKAVPWCRLLLWVWAWSFGAHVVNLVLYRALCMVSQWDWEVRADHYHDISDGNIVAMETLQFFGDELLRLCGHPSTAGGFLLKGD